MQNIYLFSIKNTKPFESNSTNVYLHCLYVPTGGILDGEASESAFKAAVDFVNKNKMIAEDINLEYMVNSTQTIAKFESIQLGE